MMTAFVQPLFDFNYFCSDFGVAAPRVLHSRSLASRTLQNFGHFLAGSNFRLCKVRLQLQVHVDDVKVRGRALSRNARIACIKRGLVY